MASWERQRDDEAPLRVLAQLTQQPAARTAETLLPAHQREWLRALTWLTSTPRLGRGDGQDAAETELRARVEAMAPLFGAFADAVLKLEAAAGYPAGLDVLCAEIDAVRVGLALQAGS